MYSGSVEMMCLFVRWRAKKLTPEERLKYLNKQFEKLDLNDFLRKYTDKSAMCKFSVPNSRELDKIFVDMNNLTEAIVREI